ncbi:MAG: hypothetical protein ABGW74_00215 [Campylobacterales bacterium]
MDKTKVDDMLIEMITPKVKQIEEKFGNGEGLTQDDINTLLLKSQYNHINHLDKKLDEVTADVASLKGEFNEFKAEINNKFDGLSAEFQTFKADIRADLAEFKTDIQVTINNTMKWYIGGTGVILILLKSLDIFVKN